MHELKKISLADDDDDMRELVATILEDLGGYSVSASASATACLESIGAFAPDMLLLDMNMPDMKGHELLEAIRTRDGYANVPCVFLTAESTWEKLVPRTVFRRVSAIVKPFDPMALPATIAEHWASFDG